MLILCWLIHADIHPPTSLDARRSVPGIWLGYFLTETIGEKAHGIAKPSLINGMAKISRHYDGLGSI